MSDAALGTRVTRRVVALFVVCALLPVAAAILLSYGRINDALIAQRIGVLRGIAAGYSTSLVDRLNVADLLLRSVAADIGNARGLQRDRDLREYFSSAVAFEPGGMRVVFGAPAQAADLGQLEKIELRSGGTATLAVAPSGGVWFLAATPGRRVALELDPRFLWGADDELPYLTYVCVLSRHGAPLNCTQGIPEAALAAIRERTSGKPTGDLAWEADGTRYLSGYGDMFLRGRFGADTWSVIASQPEEHVLAPVRALWRIVVPVVALGLLVAALLGLVQVRRTLGPLQELTRATARIASRDFDVRVPAARNDEFGQLAGAFNSMSARLGRQFNALLAHAEIDAVILSSVDLARVAEIVLRRAAELVRSDQCFLLLAEADGSYRLYSRNGPGGDEARAIGIAADDACSLLQATDGMTGLPGLPAKHAFALPIALGGALAGALVLGYDEDRRPDAEEIALLRDLGDRVAVAIATARRDQELYRRANFDALTQLPNRLLGLEELTRAVARAERQRRTLAVLFVDLDGFAAVNDSVGHAAGDQILVQSAERLRGCLRKSDLVARLGGDEFALVLPEVREATDAAVVARHVIAAFSAPFELAQTSAFVSASVGIALYPGDGASAEELLRHADLAMYQAKRAGRGQSAFFEPSMNAAARRRVELERELRQALERDEFLLHYQPQLDLRSGRIVGGEALVRWMHPTRGPVAPAQFIGFAESSGLIEDIGRWVLGAACAQFVAWQAEGLPIEQVSVNVSPRQLRQPGFARIVAAALERHGVPARALRLEVTESAVIEVQGAAAANLAALNELGTPIELDDFGTGYSSLAYLQRLPVATVKLDRSFIRTIDASPSTQAVVRAAIDMAHALGKSVVAEGVENAEQLALLSQMRCDMMQGYYLSPPVPAAAFAHFVRAKSKTQIRLAHPVVA